MAERADILAATRAEAEAGIAAASATLQAEVEEARKRLTADADALGQAAAGGSDGGLPDLLGLSTRSLMFSSMMIQHPAAPVRRIPPLHSRPRGS